MANRAQTSDLPAHLRLFERLLHEERPAAPSVTTIDPAVYIDASTFERERAALFRTRPLVASHASELPEAGSVVAHDHFGLPLLLVRDRDGRIRAFLNACRHRNTRLVKTGEMARRASIVCPYHSWTYGLDGALSNIPCEELFPGIEKGDRGLVALPCETRHGLVFVVPDPNGAIDLDAHLAGLGQDLDAFGVGTSVVFRKVEQKKATNWKLVVDAFEDGYHIHHLHRKSIGPFFKENAALFERAGNHIRACVARAPFDEAKALPPENWNAREHATFSYYLFPNVVLVMHPDYVSVISLFPLTPSETLYQHTLLTPHAPREAKEREHYQRSFDLIENGVFQAEDLEMCERAQSALDLGADWPMTLGAMEGGIALFHSILAEATAAPL